MDMFPVRVLVETVRPQHCLTCSHDGQPVVDTYAIVSGHTVLNQLVESVLNALGMPHLIAESRGLIQVNNWKPLSFESITDNLEEPIQNLLKDISSNLTLKILTKNSDSPSNECLVDLKQKLLNMAVDKQPQLLASSSGRQIRETIQQMINSEEMPPLTTDQMQALHEWLDQIAKEEDEENKRRSPNGTTQTRFNTVTEIPKLERWYKLEPHPPRQKLMSYMNILNSTAYRKTNSKVTYQQISNWFTNARAQQRANNIHHMSAQQTTSQIPVATAPIDIRTKFNASNGYNLALDRQSETDRIDGGSESPNGHDDISEHSISDHDIKESMASSPDQLLYEIAATLNGGGTTPQAPASPKQQQQRAPSPLPQSAVTINALNSMLPNFANLPLTAANQISQFASMFSNNLSNGTFAQLSKDLINPPTPVSSRESANSTRNQTKSEQSSTNQNNSENRNREGSETSNTPNVARSRLMFDPLSELPILERWFEENPHPGWMQIEQYTDALNALPYRQNYPPISTHNVKIWFKNRRAKCKRLLTNDANKMGLNQFLQGQLGIKDDSHL
jgi:hypothetical protein